MDTPLNTNLTYPKGFLDFLTLTPLRGHRVAGHDLAGTCLAAFNATLAALSPESPTLTLDQFATAAQRALDRYPGGGQPAFVTSRLASLQRLEALVADPGWDAPPDLVRRLEAIETYRTGPDRMLPADTPVVGQLDLAVLVDVLLQLEREGLAEYEDFCRFRQVAADYARLPVEGTGLTRAHWIEALQQASESPARRYGRARVRYAPDPRASLFHVT
ncbi:hypothetical protein [Arenimonas sp.]|uniref:hypothetical protein n=1 Tax=Arenimonas sp. TaxID=1872635 RepID=UPI0025D6C93F|nr:hypothetical protein [Arenimonas sp.]